MPSLIEGRAEYQQLAQDKSFLSAPASEQAAFLRDYVPTIDASFAKAPKQEQEAFINQALIPEFKKLATPQPAYGSLPRPQRQTVEAPQWDDYNPNSLGNIARDIAGATTSLGAGALKGATLGYADFTDQVGDFSKNTLGAKYYDQGLAEGAGELLGTGASVAGLEGLATKGFINAGTAIAPRATKTARILGRGTALDSAAMKVIDWAGSKNLLPTMTRWGASNAAYDLLRSHPDNQMDMGARAIDAVKGFALGAALPPLGRGANKYLAEPAGRMIQGAVKKVQDYVDFEPVNQPIGLGVPKASEKIKALYDDLLKTSQNENLTESEFKQAQEVLEKLEKGLAENKIPRGLSKLQKKAKVLRVRSKYRERFNVKKAETEQQKGTTVYNAENQPKGKEEQLTTREKETITLNEKVKVTELKGSIKEMVEQVEQAAGLPKGAGDLTAGKLEKDLGVKLTQEQRDIHTNLRAISTTDVVDAERGLQKQKPLDARALKFDEVKDNIAPGFLQDAQVIDEAMGQGKAVRVEYIAEEAGRSNEAAKITNAGNVKVENTTFTPLYWAKNKDGKVMLQGYNQRGHFTSYHLEPSINGSQILKAKATTKQPFVGEYANVYMGERPFLAKDVLSRGVRSEQGLVKTSDAITIAQKSAALIKQIEADSNIPIPSKKIMSKMIRRGKATELELMQLERQLSGNRKALEVFCNIMGMN